jgi:hypothetical protein
MARLHREFGLRIRSLQLGSHDRQGLNELVSIPQLGLGVWQIENKLIPLPPAIEPATA